MSAVQPIRPIATERDDGRIAVYISSGAWQIPREAALSLFTQLAASLHIPYSESAARFVGRVLRAHRVGPGEVGSVDGGDLQNFALDAGLIQPFECAPGGCGAHCECTPGDECLRLTTLGMELVQLADQPPPSQALYL